MAKRDAEERKKMEEKKRREEKKKEEEKKRKEEEERKRREAQKKVSRNNYHPRRHPQPHVNILSTSNCARDRMQRSKKRTRWIMRTQWQESNN